MRAQHTAHPRPTPYYAECGGVLTAGLNSVVEDLYHPIYIYIYTCLNPIVGSGDGFSDSNISKTAKPIPVQFAVLLALVVLYKSANFGDRMKAPKGAKGGQRSNFGL
jgi:hypothetical protein